MNTPHHLHLTDNQIDDALLGDLASDGATHLAGCDACQMRLTEAGAPIRSFNAVSLAWSERRSATLPAPSEPSAPAWLPRALWGATAAAVLALGVTVPLVRHSADSRSTASVQSPALPTLMASTGPVDNPVAVRDEQIARDNQMLENIDRELAPASSLDQEYGLETVMTHTSAHSAPVRN